MATETAGTRKSVWDRLQDIDPKIIYGIMLIAVFLPLIRPLGVPIGNINPEVTNLYNYLNSLPAGSIIVHDCEISPIYMAECYPCFVAFLNEHVQRSFKVIMFTQDTTALPAIEKGITEVYGKTKDHPNYGKTFVNLGFLPGSTLGLNAFAADNLFPVLDAYGNKLADMQFFKEMADKSARSWRLVVGYGSGGVGYLVQQITDVYPNCKTSSGTAAVAIPSHYAYYPNKIIGFLGGLTGAAQFEYLIGKPGIAIAGMDAQSLASLAIAVLIVVGNVAYFAARRTKAVRGG